MRMSLVAESYDALVETSVSRGLGDSGGAKRHHAAATIVTGSHESLPEIVIALKEAGFAIVAVEATPRDLPGSIRAGSVDCYVQLPPAPGDFAGPLERARTAVADHLRDRFDGMAHVAPLLAPGATVLLVADHATPAVTSALGVLADAVAGDHPAARTFVLEPSYSPGEISARARVELRASLPWSAYLNVGVELAHTDWRDEVLSFLT